MQCCSTLSSTYSHYWACTIFPMITRIGGSVGDLAPYGGGLLHVGSSAESRDRVAAFHRGLNELGFVEGTNVATEYRWAGKQNNRLPELGAGLIRRGVSVIGAPAGAETTRVLQGLTTTIPIVRSLNQPGGNVTGVADVAVDLG